jgi:hypothetical protein
MSEAKLVPDEKTIKEAAEIDIFNSKGVGVKFGSLFEKDKTIIVFIREELRISSQRYILLIRATQAISSVVSVLYLAHCR